MRNIIIWSTTTLRYSLSRLISVTSIIFERRSKIILKIRAKYKLKIKLKH